MKKEILTKLKEIEKEYGIDILFAVESGSRAWGFSSINSDYDVRFVYVRPMDDYLLLTRKKDVIIREFPKELDFHGWDLEKALKLLYKGNPPLLEWLRSPEEYRGGSEYHLELKSLSETCWSPQTAIYHYCHMANGNYRAYIYNKSFVKQKKYLYILRPLLCCLYIEKYAKFPPVKFQELLAKVEVSPAVLTEIHKLVELKKSSKELDMCDKNLVLNSWIEKTLEYQLNYAKTLPKLQNQMGVLNDFFKKVVKK